MHGQGFYSKWTPTVGILNLRTPPDCTQENKMFWSRISSCNSYWIENIFFCTHHSALLAEKNEADNFFFNKSDLKEYQSATQNKKSCVPGSAYIKKILPFIDSHYKLDELFMEYLYGDCFTVITERCSFCSNKGWTSLVPMKRIPWPVPDPENPTHFKSVNDTPTTTDRKRAASSARWFSATCKHKENV